MHEKPLQYPCIAVLQTQQHPLAYFLGVFARLKVFFAILGRILPVFVDMLAKANLLGDGRLLLIFSLV
jgi:hypothetical protein